MTAHHKLGASSSERWFACPGSIALSENVPKLPSSKYAAQGNAAHKVAASILDNGMLLYEIGEEIEYDGYKFTIAETDDYETTVSLEHIMVYVDYVLERSRENKITGKNFLVEQKVNIPQTDLFGTADAVLIDPYNFIEVVDFKYGAGVKVIAKDNTQLLYYAAAAFFSLPEAVRNELPKIIVTVVQPRAPGGGIESFTYTPSELLQYLGRLMEARETVITANAALEDVFNEYEKQEWDSLYLKAGEHCRWCPANPCPALQTYAVNIISSGDAKADFASEAKVQLPAPEQMPVETLVNIFHNGGNVKEFIDKCYAYLNLLAKEGKINPADYDLKFVEGVKHKKWIDENEVKIALIEDYKYSREQIYTEPKLKSPNQIKTLLKGKQGQEFYDKYSYKPDGEISLAPLADKRPAINYSKAEKDFADEALEVQLTKSIERETM